MATLGIILAASRVFVGLLEWAGPALGLPAAVVALLSPVAAELPEMMNVVTWVRQGNTRLALANISAAMMIQAHGALRPGSAVHRMEGRRAGGRVRNRHDGRDRVPAAAVGSLVSNPVNGTVIVLFVWIFDVFFGPANGAADRLATRGLPTHFVTLWMVDLPSGHGGRPGDLGLGDDLDRRGRGRRLAAGRDSHPGLTSSDPARRPRPSPRQLAAAGRASWRDARRNRVQWVLFVVVPAVFILTAEAVTPNKPITLTLRERGHAVARTFAMPDVHGATMAPIAITSVAALVGLFVLLDSRAGDRRVLLAGLRPGALPSARLGVLACIALAASVVALATTTLVFHPANWSTYAAANLLLAFTYALIGALLAPFWRRSSAASAGCSWRSCSPTSTSASPKARCCTPNPPRSRDCSPGYGGSRVLLDGALTDTFDETRSLLAGLAWLAVLTLVVALTYRHATQPTRPTDHARLRPASAGRR